MSRGYWLGEPQLIDDLADVGAPYPQRMPARTAAPMYPTPYAAPGYQRAALAAGAIPYRRIMPTIPGVPAIGFRDQPVGFGASAFTATSGTTLTLTAQPQRPFKGRRLVVDIARTGATATGLVSISNFSIGSNNQLVGANAIGAAAFAGGAFGVDMQLDACAAALTMTITFTISAAPAMTDRVDFNATLFGETIGS